MSIAVGVNESTDNTAITTTSSTTDTTAANLQSNFLTLLVTQLKNQDPTNPMDNSQLTTQLAQINTLSGIEKLNTTLGSISGQINSSQSLQASALVGKGVMVDGAQILVGTSSGSTSTTPFGLSLEQASTATTATITDSSGKVVQTINLGALSAGVHTFSWDGTETDGTTAPDGKYTLSISASNATGQLTAQPLNYALVNGVTTNTDGAILDLGTMGNSTVANVRQIL
ncbi:flagellar hook assembly protein FlgD [Erwinia tracheiphila]|uniref:Basal-body rod modification protein FlgD n=1 Tax=Erwinia tracheiphila TaxID=65700 RepID=A0A0M2KCZ9_9GAMM|nr:flagellar hook assembly protein FlgD [Erwinia tracheiphila]AXF76135.1 flagellar hook assembly protein FlgD [Erwinia tracheiphila]EOS96685.1 flagellar basal body rod modification protein [Erwinia tracheiphila PSU-1]KKF34861.1 flagellar basal body rod modification protein [Erwinia tracheiphila]UIA85197.1 flagellar hook assembly protein FlgD [Erwinia tracheiphila]UIA86528.1 flagellar hook assembly protein FlgD [Erwinia tracheiphila]